MRGAWAVTTDNLQRCGYDLGHDLGVGELMWVMGKIVRCRDHAPAHTQLTDQEADALHHAQEALAAEAAARNTAPPNIRKAVPYAMGFDHATHVEPHAHNSPQATERVTRVTPPVTPRPFAEVADVHDPKAHAFND